MLFKDDHLPPGFIFSDDPSHMKQEAAKEFLDFIRKRQVLHPKDVFGFEYWLDSNGGLEDPADTWQDSGISHKKKRSRRKAMAKERKQAVTGESDDDESYVEDPDAEGSETETSDDDEPEADESTERNEAEQLPAGSKGKGKQREAEAPRPRPTMKRAAAEKLPDVALPNPECADRGAESAGQSAQIAHGGSEQDGQGGSGSTDRGGIQTLRGDVWRRALPDKRQNEGYQHPEATSLEGKERPEEPPHREAVKGMGKEAPKGELRLPDRRDGNGKKTLAERPEHQPKTWIREQTPGPARQAGPSAEVTEPLAADTASGIRPKSNPEPTRIIAKEQGEF